MTSFADDLKRATMRFNTDLDATFVRAVEMTRDSIVEGSVLTGAPGQPVGQYGPGYHPGKVGGTLKGSFQTEFESPSVAHITTNEVYAPGIEDLVGPYGPIAIRSTVGGGHSVKLTVASFDKIVDAAAAQVAGVQ